MTLYEVIALCSRGFIQKVKEKTEYILRKGEQNINKYRWTLKNVTQACREKFCFVLFSKNELCLRQNIKGKDLCHFRY